MKKWAQQFITVILTSAFLTFGLFFNTAYASSISFDATAKSSIATTSPIAWNHTVAASANFLVVGVYAGSSIGTATVTAVTYNGVSMTEVSHLSGTLGARNGEASIWFLHAPATGTHQVSVTWSTGSSPEAFGVSTSYIGAQNSDTADSTNVAGPTTSGTASVVVTTVADNAWVFGMMIVQNALTAGHAGNTVRGEASGTNFSGGGEDTNAPVHPAGNQTMSWTLNSTTRAWIMVGASFAPLVTSTTRHASVYDKTAKIFVNGAKVYIN